MSDYKLKIGITQGDTNGIGWEVILRTLGDSRIVELFTPVVYGSQSVAKHYAATLDEECGTVQFNVVGSAREARRGRVNLVECGTPSVVVAGEPSKEAGAAAVEALERAIADVESGELDALVTAPIDKEMAQSENFTFTGHTEFVAAHAEGEPMMIMCSERLRVGLQTIHIPVADVAKSLSKEKIVASLNTLRQTLKQDFGIVEPRIAVLALNPHAGEGGLLGSEEQEIIQPAIVEAFESGVLAFGPFPADGLFASGAYAKYDAVLAMYHDQGLTPFKTLSPDGVNFTAGLSVVRTSPDHGTAFDIAGKAKADAQSMRNAIYAAMDIVRNREAWERWNARPLQHFEREKGRDVSIKDLKLPEIEE
jgi:4-hydroxythreonine-4-phosphate dehydrogenase